MFYSTVVSLTPAGTTISTVTPGAGPSTNEVQRVQAVASAGSYTVTFDSLTTDPIAYDATEAEIQAIFDDAFGAGNSIITGDADDFTVEWAGDYEATDVAELTTTDTGLYNGIAIPESRGNSTTPVTVCLRPASGDLISIGGSSDGCNYPLLDSENFCVPVTVAYGPIYAEGDGDLYVFMSGLDQTPA